MECRANTVHACVTNIVKDEATQLEIVACMIEKNDNPMKIGQKVSANKRFGCKKNAEACYLRYICIKETVLPSLITVDANCESETSVNGNVTVFVFIFHNV